MTSGEHQNHTAYLNQIFQDAPIPIAIYNADGDLIDTNYAQQAFTAGLGDLTGIGDYNALADLRSQRHGHREQFKRALSGEVVDYEFSVHQQAENEADNDDQLSFSRLMMPLLNDAGEVHAVVSVLIDVTDRKREERAQAKLQDQLLHTQKLESLGVMAGGIAHDFNNLLVGVLGNASMLMEEMDRHSPYYASIEAIETAARRAADVASQMLAFSGRGQFRTERVDLSDAVEEITKLLKGTVSSRAQLVMTLSNSLPVIDADPTQLRQIIMNLITNAADAIGERNEPGFRGDIHVSTGMMPRNHPKLVHCYGNPDRQAVQFVYVEVTDTGNGMDEETIQRIFDPFFTTKSSGRGLGLSAVLGIVSRHGGGLSVQSTPGEGSCMTVMLPATGAAIMRDETVERARPPAPVDTSSHRLLIVDDEEAVRTILTLMLENLGYQVESTASGQEAEAIMQRSGEKFSAALVDLTLPDQDGFSTADHLLQYQPALTLIYMSGYEAETVPDATHFLHKPFTLAVLRDVIDQALAST